MMNDESKPRTDLKVRTKHFALRIIRLYSALPTGVAAQTIGKQMLRSGMSVGEQYREGCRTRSDAEFISKIESALQELEETTYWLELRTDAEIVKVERLKELLCEANELAAILTASVKTVKGCTGRS